MIVVIVFGCGGMSLWIIDNFVMIGNVINNIFCFVVFWMEIISGNKMMIFILKNIGIFIINFVNNIV